MHEISIITSAIKEIEYQCRINKIAKVTSITLAIGKLTALDSENLRFIFNRVREGTLCEGAFLDIEEIEGKAYCEKCKNEFNMALENKACPICGERSVNITGGYEILLYRIDGE